MAESIFRTITREIRNAVRDGKEEFFAFGKFFKIEHVDANIYRIHTAEYADCGIRWRKNGKELSFFMA